MFEYYFVTVKMDDEMRTFKVQWCTTWDKRKMNDNIKGRLKQAYCWISKIEIIHVEYEKSICKLLV